MLPENQERLIREFPQLYRGYHSKENCMSRGFECGNGWYPLIFAASKAISDLAEKYGLSDDDFPIVRQCKEKFGIVRMSTGCMNPLDNDRLLKINDQIREIIQEAETLSSLTCELCGTTENVSFLKDGWFRVRCAHCEAERWKGGS